MIEFKVGIIGAGHIAGIVADTLNKLDAFCPYAIASRDINRANEFGDRYNIEKRYGSYEELANDEEIELIYIATPHSHHAEQAKMCINAGKPLLVEKAFSYDAPSTEEVLKLAREKNVFCCEAMWIRFLPMYDRAKDIIKKGVIGRINSITCSLGYDLRQKERVLKPELGGGSLLDLGVYPINAISMLFEQAPNAAMMSAAKYPTGVDAQETIQFRFKDGGIAQAFITMMYKADNNMFIYGDRGYMEITNMNNPEEIKVYSLDRQLIADIKPPENQITGYEYEFLVARNAIISGKIEVNRMPHAETLGIMTFIDNLKKQIK